MEKKNKRYCTPTAQVLYLQADGLICGSGDLINSIISSDGLLNPGDYGNGGDPFASALEAPFDIHL